MSFLGLGGPKGPTLAAVHVRLWTKDENDAYHHLVVVQGADSREYDDVSRLTCAVLGQLLPDGTDIGRWWALHHTDVTSELLGVATGKGRSSLTGRVIAVPRLAGNDVVDWSPPFEWGHIIAHETWVDSAGRSDVVAEATVKSQRVV